MPRAAGTAAALNHEASEARDRILTGVRNTAFVEEMPARGEHNPTTGMGPDLFIGVADLHGHLTKVVYELERA